MPEASLALQVQQLATVLVVGYLRQHREGFAIEEGQEPPPGFLTTLVPGVRDQGERAGIQEERRQLRLFGEEFSRGSLAFALFVERVPDILP